MKRSEINKYIAEALVFFEEMNFRLPPWSVWGLIEWNNNKENCEEIFQNLLGWDLTDFGSGEFEKTGLLLFTIRNGNLNKDKKTYAEKIMIVGEKQVTPMHFHRSKMEDIINRGGGNLCIELYPSDEQGKIDDKDVNISIDGRSRNIKAGECVILEPGESITLYQGLYHSFYGQDGHGTVLVGEVSTVNDDQLDNNFVDEIGRFPDIIEDLPPTHLLIGDYAKFL